MRSSSEKESRAEQRRAALHGSVRAGAGAALVALLVSLLIASSASAAACEVEYTGEPNGGWFTAQSWSGKVLPKATQTVCIPAGKGTVVVSGGTAEAKTVTAQSGLQIEALSKLLLSDAEPGDEHASRFTDLSVTGTLETAGTWVVIDGNATVVGEISRTVVKGTDSVRLIGGTLSGTGMLNIPFVNVAGDVAPGGAGFVGTLQFGSTFEQNEGATLSLDLESAIAFDRLEHASTFRLFGKVAVNLLGDYSPAVGQTWDFVPGEGASTPERQTTNTPESFFVNPILHGLELELHSVLLHAPTALTLAATALATTSATLNGTVDPNGTTVSSCEFEYGTTTAYGSFALCGSSPGAGALAVAESATVGGLAPATSYHYRLSAASGGGAAHGADQTFTTSAAFVSGPGAGPVDPKTIEHTLLGCTSTQLLLSDVYVRAGHVAISGSAAKSLAGKRVKILFGSANRQVATATVSADGSYATTAPLPPARIRERVSTRYTAEIGSLRALHLKLTRRLLLEPPHASGTTVTLNGEVLPPLRKPIAPIVVEQQLLCGKAAIVKRVTPAASGRFHLTLTVPAHAGAAIYTIKSSVAANAHARAHGFTTYSLPLPVAIP